MFFDSNFGAGDVSTRITYLGFRGEFDQIISRQAVIAGQQRTLFRFVLTPKMTLNMDQVYESRPMLEDHQLPANNAPKMGQ